MPMLPMTSEGDAEADMSRCQPDNFTALTLFQGKKKYINSTQRGRGCGKEKGYGEEKGGGVEKGVRGWECGEVKGCRGRRKCGTSDDWVGVRNGYGWVGRSGEEYVDGRVGEELKTDGFMEDGAKGLA